MPNCLTEHPRVDNGCTCVFCNNLTLLHHLTQSFKITTVYLNGKSLPSQKIYNQYKILCQFII